MVEWKSMQYGGTTCKENDIIGFCIDIDNKIMNFYLNGNDLGIVFTDFYIGNGITPCLSIGYGARCIIVTNEKKFKYDTPNGYESIQYVNIIKGV